MADSGKAAETPAAASSSPPAAAPNSPPAAAPSSPPAASAPSPTPAPETPAASGAGNAEAGILPAAHWEALPAEEEIVDDGASVYSGAASSTGSLSASIYEYRTLLGRTYHSDIGQAEHWIPNDERQLESMDIHHHMCTLLLKGKLFMAPLEREKLEHVLDIGTGTGLWAVDFGDEYPDAEIIGSDITPIQTTYVPPNVRFELEDANLSWTFKTNHFDYVHLRNMLGTIADWSKFYQEAFRVCKPGGWMEHHEEGAEWYAYDTEITENSAMGQFKRVFSEGGKKFGRTFDIITEDIQRKCMEEAGFVDIVVKDIEVPIGNWSKDPKKAEIGFWAKRVLEVDLEGFINYMWGAVMGWSPIEIQVYLAHLRKQMKEPMQTWYPHRVVYGRKPE